MLIKRQLIIHFEWAKAVIEWLSKTKINYVYNNICVYKKELSESKTQNNLQKKI